MEVKALSTVRVLAEMEQVKPEMELELMVRDLQVSDDRV